MQTKNVLQICLLLFIVPAASFAYNQTFYVDVGQEFTVYTTYKSGTYAVFWDYDYSIVQPVTTIGSATTSVTFRAIAPSVSPGSIITATTYYMKSGTTSSGANKYFEDWRVVVEDNSTVSLSPGSITIMPGDYEIVNARTSNASYKGGYKWSANTPTVVTVAGSGSSARIYANSPGSAIVTVELDNGNRAQCYVTVPNVDPTDITVSSSLTAYVGEYARVSRTLIPSNAQTTLSWYTSNSNILTVNSSGEVYGLTEGTATVYARTSNGLVSNNCTVTVKHRVPTSVTLKNNNLYLPIGKSSQLTAVVSPSNARYTLTWKSDNADIADVSSSGMVVAKKAGTTTIRVTTDNGYTAACTVTVPPNCSAIYLPNKISILYGKTRKLSVSCEPMDAYKEIVWSSSAPDVASVSNDGTLMTHKVGSAVIKALSSNGLEATCSVEVEPLVFYFSVWTNSGECIAYNLEEHPKVIHRDGMLIVSTYSESVEYPEDAVRKFTIENKSRERFPEAIDIPNEVILKHKSVLDLEYSLLPLDYDIETKLEWISDAPEIVTVDSKGTICAVGVGEATITVKASNGTVASCVVTVPAPTYFLIAWLKDGRKDAYALEEHPSVVYSDGMLILSTTWQQMEYPHDIVRKFTMTDTDNPEEPVSPETDIFNVQHPNNMQVSYGDVVFSSCRPGAVIKIFSLDGRLLNTAVVNAGGSAIIRTADYPAGVYIIQSETITHKIIKR